MASTTNFGTGISASNLGGRPSSSMPDEISNEIIQDMPKSSVLLTRARRVRMSRKTRKQPVLATLPEAYWVDEGGLKSTSSAGWEDVSLIAEELAVIVPVPDSVIDDANIPIWNEVRPLIAESFGKKIDGAGLFGVDKPSSWGTDVFTGATAANNIVQVGTNTDLAGDVAALGQKIAAEGFAINGFASQPGLNWQLVGLRNTNGTPIYVPALSNGTPSTLYGYPLNEVLNGAWDSEKAILLAADWSKFIIGIRQDMTYQVFDQGVITDSTGKVVFNLMQQDAKALRVVMRVGFAVANPMTRVVAKGSQYPAGFVTPAAGE